MADLSIRDLTVEYASGDYIVRPIENLNLEASTGELVLLLGPSGCGKTTLLSCLAGILRPTAGEIEVSGVPIQRLEGEALTLYRRNTVGIVFQAFNLIPSLTAFENVEVPLLTSRAPRAQSKARARELLERVGLGDRLQHKPSDLSGGQQQRVAIARALAHDPPLLLADEPTAHLDYVQVESILRLIRELAVPGRLVIVATHDPRMIPLADRVVDMAPKLMQTQTGPRRFEFAAGEVIFEQGSRGELIYIVERGEVEIVRRRAHGGDEIVAVVPQGEYFGELGPLLGFPRAATARARTDVVMTGYPVADFRDLLRDDPRLAKLLGAAAKVPTPNGKRTTKSDLRVRRGPKKTPAPKKASVAKKRS